MKVKFFSEKKKANNIGNSFKNKISEILINGKYTNGRNVEQLEKNCKKYFKSKYAVAVNSGTSALHLVLLSLNIKKNDEIIIPSITFIASAAAISYVGAKVVLADINQNDWLINTNKIEKLITKKTKAIMVVHLHGLMCDMDKIKMIAKKNKLKIIEDAAQAHGSKFKKNNPGYYSHAATLSFYPTKNLGAIGEGGLILTNNKTIYEKSKRMRSWSHKKYNFHEISFNYRMSEVIAASLNLKIKYLNDDIKKRIRISKIYKKNLNIKSYSVFNNKVKIHSYHIFAIRVNQNKRRSIIKILNKKGIQTNIHYPYSLSELVFFKLNNKKNKTLISNTICRELISLPIYPELKKEEIMYICKILNSVNNKLVGGKGLEPLTPSV